MKHTVVKTIIHRSKEIVADAHSQLSELLEVTHPDNDSFAAGFQMMDSARIKNTSWKNVGNKLGLNGAQIKSYIDLLRLLRAQENAPSSDDVAMNKILIASLQLVNLLERVKESHPQLNWSCTYHLPTETDPEKSVRQIRAIELLIREIIDEAWGSQQKLIARIQALLNEADAARIIKNAEKGNVLSGTLLEQLRIIFSDKEDFPDYYDTYFDTASGLNYTATTRETLSAFLQDLNPIRNKIAHHKVLNEPELLLLNEYFNQVLEPLRQAHQEGRLQADPDALYNAPEEAVKQYQQRVEKQLNELNETTARTEHLVKAVKQDTAVVRRKSGWILAGIVVITVITGVTLKFSGGSFVNTEIIKDKVSDVQNQVTDVQDKLSNVKQETSSDPRKELANLGIQWDQGVMEQAIKRGDLRTVQLFNEAGMPWRTQFLTAALYAWHRRDQNPNIARTIDYITQHPENRIFYESGRCSNAIDLTKMFLDTNSIGKDLNNKVIRFLCENDAASQDLKKRIAETTQELSTLKSEYQHYIQPQAACFNALIKDNGDAIFNAFVSAGHPTPGISNIGISSQAATMTYHKYSDYAQRKVPMPVFKESVKFYCDTMSALAKERYPNRIAELDKEHAVYLSIAAQNGIKL